MRLAKNIAFGVCDEQVGGGGVSSVKLGEVRQGGRELT